MARIPLANKLIVLGDYWASGRTRAKIYSVIPWPDLAPRKPPNMYQLEYVPVTSKNTNCFINRYIDHPPTNAIDGDVALLRFSFGLGFAVRHVPDT